MQGRNVRLVCRHCKQLKGGRCFLRCAICSACEPLYSYPLARCEQEGKCRGHEVVGNLESEPMSANSENTFDLHPVGVALQMCDSEAWTERSASTEWSGDSDDS